MITDALTDYGEVIAAAARTEERRRLGRLLQQAIAGAEADAEHLNRTPASEDRAGAAEARLAAIRQHRAVANRLRDIARDLGTE